MPSQRHILAHDILALPWAAAYNWQGLADQAHSLETAHRTLARETITVRAVLPSGCGVPPQTVPGASRAGLSSQLSEGSSGPLPDTDAEIARITDALRRAIRLGGLAYHSFAQPFPCQMMSQRKKSGSRKVAKAQRKRGMN